MESKKRFTITTKMYLFVIVIIVFAVASISVLSFIINVRQIDSYFKRLAMNCADTYSYYVDVDFLARLRAAAESDEFQALRDQAEENDNEYLIQEYLEDHGLWDDYVKQREHMITFQESMQDIRYLYLVAWGDKDSNVDMYLLDADDVPIYETGYYEDREAEFEGVDPSDRVEPVISQGDWGWLCSAYVPVYDNDGNIVCHVGCDVEMEDIMSERMANLTYIILGAVACTCVALAGAIIFVNKNIVKPLNSITKGMRSFSPAVGKDYKEAGVIDLNINTKDEIRDIYDELHSMQIKIVDYIGEITTIERDKEKAEAEARIKEKELGKVSAEANRDALTGVGNKNAYKKMIDELNRDIEAGTAGFAIVMMDVNRLKNINDDYGHSAGDSYIRGCCHIICETFKHSPVYRIGGDEFVAVIAGDDFASRFERLAKLKAKLEKTYNSTEREPWNRYSASCGMAEYTEDDSNVESVFKRADKNMYDEKVRFKEKYGFAVEKRD